jgi:thioredoxin 1
MKAINNFEEYNQVIEQPKPVLLDFYAGWCGPCKALEPVVEKLADQYRDDVEVRKVNVEEFPELAQEYSVRSIPALFLVQNGEVKDRLVGYQSPAVLEKTIRQSLVAA